jgi:ribonuclease HI
MAKKKYYVVWEGKQPGIFESWAECNEQISGFTSAKYKSFKTLDMAEKAYQEGYKEYWGKDIFETTLNAEELEVLGKPILESISVDGAWNNITGKVEYQGVDTKTKKVIFHQGTFEDGTINIVEFLAIIHALAHCKKQGLKVPIYSDSKIAIKWVKKSTQRTKHPRSEKNEELFKLVDRAVTWLGNNEIENEILKWETRAWGENPADFGRK